MKGPSPSSSYVAVQSLKPSIDLGPHKDAIMDIFFSLHIIGGHIALPLTLVTMVILKTVARRHPTLINLLISWIVYASANLLLLYSGERRAAKPDSGVCLAQASLIYGSTVGVSAATLGLVLQLWLEFRGVKLSDKARGNGTLYNIQLLVFPWFFFIVITIIAIAFGVRNPTLVSIQWQFYCTLSSNAIIYTVSALTLVFLALTLGFQASVVRTLYKASRQFKAFNQTSYHLVLRVGVFSLYSLITFIVSVIITLQPDSIFPYLFVSTLPLAVFLIFGTQKENLRFWLRVPGRKRADKHIPLAPITFKTPTALIPTSAPSSGREFRFDLDKRTSQSPYTSNNERV